MRHRLGTRLGHRLVTRLGRWLGIRWGSTAALATALLVGGCGTPGGIDGDLTNGWGAMPAATGFEPQASTCHLANFNPVGARSTYEEVGCPVRHRTETSYVGTYEPPAADAAEPPAPGSAGARAAYQVCDQKTTTYVGGPWRTARLWVGVTQPTAAAWAGGARWYRCEVVELTSVEDDGDVVQRAGSLHDVLASGASELLLGCYAVQQDRSGAIASMPAVGCTAKHDAEFAGVWNATGASYPTDDAGWERLHDGCRGVIAAYAGVPNDKDLQYRTGVVSLPGGEDVWRLGDRGVRCYLWLDGAELTSTLKGKGTDALPVQYK